MKCVLAQSFISWVMEAGCWHSLGSCSLSIYRFGNGLLGFHSAACSCVAENEAEVLSARSCDGEYKASFQGSLFPYSQSPAIA